ncbi:hypothetical protein C8R44DRAFT_736781 [Mycena epipterygia]|nr:hypothetical protein C8R44DRAFT_736781 [Mycena epipterygia]
MPRTGAWKPFARISEQRDCEVGCITYVSQRERYAGLRGDGCIRDTASISRVRSHGSPTSGAESAWGACDSVAACHWLGSPRQTLQLEARTVATDTLKTPERMSGYRYNGDATPGSGRTIWPIFELARLTATLAIGTKRKRKETLRATPGERTACRSLNRAHVYCIAARLLVPRRAHMQVGC